MEATIHSAHDAVAHSSTPLDTIDLDNALATLDELRTAVVAFNRHARMIGEHEAAFAHAERSGASAIGRLANREIFKAVHAAGLRHRAEVERLVRQGARQLAERGEAWETARAALEARVHDASHLSDAAAPPVFETTLLADDVVRWAERAYRGESDGEVAAEVPAPREAELAPRPSASAPFTSGAIATMTATWMRASALLSRMVNVGGSSFSAKRAR